jgi:hypothetical protein
VGAEGSGRRGKKKERGETLAASGKAELKLTPRSKYSSFLFFFFFLVFFRPLKCIPRFGDICRAVGPQVVWPIYAFSASPESYCGLGH